MPKQVNKSAEITETIKGRTYTVPTYKEDEFGTSREIDGHISLKMFNSDKGGGVLPADLVRVALLHLGVYENPDDNPSKAKTIDILLVALAELKKL